MGVDYHLRNVRLTPGGPIQDLFLRAGRLEDAGTEAAEEVEGAGCLLLPGMIDPHVHLRSPGMEAAEDWDSGTRAALYGGVTTVFDMPNTRPPTTSAERLNEKRALARVAHVDWGLYLGATLDGIAEVAQAGNIAGLKVYMGSSTGDLLLPKDEGLERVFRVAAESGIPVALHAEDESMIRERMAQLTGDEGPEIHNWVRPPEAAASAVRRALELGRRTGAVLYFCHVSTAAELALLREARQAGQRVYVEATPHHLFLDETDVPRLGNYGKVNPPLRSPEDREALWQAVLDGTVDAMGTDHAPHLREAKERPYREAPSGMPGLETVLPLLLTAVLEGRLPFDRLVPLTSGRAREIFDVPHLGWVLVDLDSERALHEGEIVSRCGWSPFVSRSLRGWPVKVWVKSMLTWNRGEVTAPGAGTEVLFRKDSVGKG